MCVYGSLRSPDFNLQDTFWKSLEIGVLIGVAVIYIVLSKFYRLWATSKLRSPDKGVLLYNAVHPHLPKLLWANKQVNNSDK